MEGRGFGTRMMAMVLTQVDGAIERVAGEEGFTAILRIPSPADRTVLGCLRRINRDAPTRSFLVPSDSYA